MTVSSRGVAAHEFFRKAFDGGSVAAASRECKLPYTTVYRVAHRQSVPRARVAMRLESWSKRLPAAARAGVHISAVLTLGLNGP